MRGNILRVSIVLLLVYLAPWCFNRHLLIPVRAADPGCSESYPDCLGTTVVEAYTCNVDDDGACSFDGFTLTATYPTCDSNCSFDMCSSNDLDSIGCTTVSETYPYSFTYCVTTGCNTPGNCCGNNSVPTGTPTPIPPPTPTPTPNIQTFEISNFVTRTNPSILAPNNKFYIILANQMRAGYKAKLSWNISGAGITSRDASCEYKDVNGVVQTGPGYNCEFSGPVGAVATQEVQPKKGGTVTYTLTVTNAGGTATKTITAGIKEFQLFEIHPSLPITLMPNAANAASLFTILREHLRVLNTVP